MKVAFVTGNKGKLDEARHALAAVGVEVTHVDAKPVEIQADTLAEVARAKAVEVARRHAGPFFVDDAGLFVDALNGFPGVYSAHALKTIGTGGLLKLMEGVSDRRARFEAVIAYRGANGSIDLFEGVSTGRLAERARDRGQGFGFDPVFEPEGHRETFAELPIGVKNRLSHRGRALALLVERLARGP